MEDKNIVNTLQVQSTNDASIVSKCSMANNNYVKDKFVKYFVHKEKSRASLIHLGYYTRAVVISGILTRFVKFLHCQKLYKIISCGAGFDTTYWRLTEDNLLNENSIYIEIDYPDVINKKFNIIKESPKLCEFLKIPENDEIVEVKKLKYNYYLISADLCDLTTIKSLLTRINIDFDIPTLFLSECVITYMKTADSDKLLKWMTGNFQNVAFLIYEQIHPEDGFGSVMMRHFRKLQSTLNSVLTYPDCASHKKRYHSLGFESSIVTSEWDIFLYLTDEKERERVLSLQQFDEFEEFHLKCVHYVVGISANKFLSSFVSQINGSWCFKTHEDFGCFRVEDKNLGLELFGHSTCMTRGIILLFGGFSPGGRSKKFWTFSNWKIKEVQVEDGVNVRFDAVHGSAMAFELNERPYIGLYGGRTSPDSVINNGNFVILEYNPGNLIMKSVLSCDGGPTPRYRSSVVCHPHGRNGVSAWIFGGRTSDLKETLSDLWQLVIQPDGEELRFKWVKVERESAPCARMSHSAVVCCAKNAMYVTCGLDSRNFTVLNDIWKWDFLAESWEEVRPKAGSLIPRYGHTSHIYGNILYMIGGVNTEAGCQPGITLFNLDALDIAEYSIQPFRAEPILLFNHSSAIIEDDKGCGEIVIFGGGGNCFSFGTYFNKRVHGVPLKQLGR